MKDIQKGCVKELGHKGDGWKTFKSVQCRTRSHLEVESERNKGRTFKSDVYKVRLHKEMKGGQLIVTGRERRTIKSNRAKLIKEMDGIHTIQ